MRKRRVTIKGCLFSILFGVGCLALMSGLFSDTKKLEANELEKSSQPRDVLTVENEEQLINEPTVVALEVNRRLTPESTVIFTLADEIVWSRSLTEELNAYMEHLAFRIDENSNQVIVDVEKEFYVEKIELVFFVQKPSTVTVEAIVNQQTTNLLELNYRYEFEKIKSDPVIGLRELNRNVAAGAYEQNEMPAPIMPRAISRTPVDHLGLVINEKFQQPIGTGPYFLTPKMLVFTDQTNQNGAIWSRKKLDLTQNFKLGSYLFLGDRRANQAADGMTFTLQNDERMLTNPSSVIGVRGMGLGVYGDGSGPYVRNALSIEFDTFHNGGSMDADIVRNSNRGHIAVTKPKFNNAQSGEHRHLQLALTNHLSNNMWRRFDVIWDASKQELTFSLIDPRDKTSQWSYGQVTPGTQRTTFRVNPQQEFGGTEVYWGFTGSTGSNFQENAIVIDEVPQEPNGSQLNKIRNITANSSAETRVTGSIDDVFEVTSAISYMGGYYPWENIVTDFTIPEGLEYVPNSSKINGQAITDAQLTLVNGKISYPKFNLTVNNREHRFSYELKLMENTTRVFRIPSQSKGDDLLVVGNNLEIDSLALATVAVNYQDDTNKILDSKRLIGRVGTPYITEQLTFEGLDFLDVSPIGSPATGAFSATPQTVTYRYKRNYLTPVLTVTKEGTNEVAAEARVGDVLNYKLTLTSAYPTPGLFYRNLTVKLPINEHLANITVTDLSFQSEDGEHQLAVSYDETTRTITGTATEPVPRHMTYILSYKTAVKDLTPIDTVIKSQATIEGAYSDDILIPKLSSNEVETKVIAGFLEFVSAPEKLSFGQRKIAISEQTYGLTNDLAKKLTVKDNRVLGSKWSMKAKIVKNLTGKTSQTLLTSSLYYLNNDEIIPLVANQSAIIYTKVSDSHEAVNISDSWNQTNGLRLKVQPGIARSEAYEGVIGWTLQDVPDNR